MANQSVTNHDEVTVPERRLQGGHEAGATPLVVRPGSPRWRRLRRRVWKLLSVVVLGGALAVFHAPLLTRYARLFEVNDPAPSDAIVLLLGDLRHRPALATSLYRQGIAPRIYMVTLEEQSGGEEETARTVRRLVHLGVPREAIHLLPDRAESTEQEARAMRKEAERSGWKRVTVVSSDFHTRRARWIFRRALAGTGVTIHMAAAQEPERNATNWWRSDEGLVRYVDETLKMIYYRLRY
jgi:uncharacterized SAM-binding protein YcdF (DUF218 family)